MSFTFPKGYPHELHPGGTPIVDLERSPLISIRNRAFMLRRLRMLRESRRPCLEACLRFLLYGNEDEKQRRTAHVVYDSSSDEESTFIMRSKQEPIVTPLHSDKNIAEPVTSQGVFGPNGTPRPATIENHFIVFHNRSARLLQPCSATYSPQPPS